MARILHVCNWASGITTRNVNELKQWSKHSHELVTKIQHPLNVAYEVATYSESTTTKEIVLQLAEEADILHFHAVGYAGSPGYPGTIHSIDWSQFLGKKLFVVHAMCSYVTHNEKSFERGNGNLFLIENLSHYNALMGPHLSCKISYESRLKYVPDMIPINDWLYTPLNSEKQKVSCTFKNGDVVDRCVRQGINIKLLPFPTQMSECLHWRRKNCKVTMDNCTDGHWGLFGMESLSQGIPCATYIHPINRECFYHIEAPQPPFTELSYTGTNAPAVLKEIMDMSDSDWEVLSYKCRQWIEKFYYPQRLVPYWDNAYDEVLSGA